MEGVLADAGAGGLRVVATNGRGATPEEWVEILMPRLISISETAPEPLRLQAEAFQGQLRAFLLKAMRRAIASDRTTIANRLTEAGHPDLAAAIKDI